VRGVRPTNDHSRLLRGSISAIVLAVVWASAEPVLAQVQAQARSSPTPAWDKGIRPIDRESYWNAVECGKQGGEDPPCVFWDTGICKNDDFALTFYTPYKMVAYEVWRVVRQKQPAPTPSYQEAQRTRVTIAVAPVRGSKNAFTDLVLKRGGRRIQPVDRSLADGGGRFTFDPSAFAATAGVTLDLVGRAKTVSCAADPMALARFR